MGEFFRGWRRKTGVVTLLMALIFGCWWVRSRFIADQVTVFLGRYYKFSLNSDQNGIEWDMSTVSLLPITCHWESAPIEPIEPVNPLDWHDPEWRWDWYGFHFGGRLEAPNSEVKQSVLIFPYWAVAIPMTLISLWLLVWKPSKSNQKKITEPVTNDGA